MKQRLLNETAKSPAVFGLLSITFGLMIAFHNYVQLTNLHITANSIGNGAIPLEIIKMMSDINLIIKPLFIIKLIFSITLVVIGFGQRHYKSWTEQATRTWSMSALLALIIMCIYLFIYARNLQTTLFNYYVKNIFGQKISYSPELIGIMLIMSELIFFAPYPILLLVFFSKDKVKKSLTQ